MQLTHEFTVPASIDEAWAVMSDVERVAACMPGASLTSVVGDEFEGQVKVRIGPMQLTYLGSGTVVERDEAARTMAIEATGKEARGQGTARARVSASLKESGDRTMVEVRSDLDVTGKPAQFGQGAMYDVGQKLLDKFATELAAEFDAMDNGQSAEAEDGPGTARRSSPDDALDLMEVAGAAIFKRLAPLAAAMIVLAVWWWRRNH